MKNNDAEVVNSSTVEWYANADYLATFLARINPFWEVNQWKQLLYQYIQFKIQEIVAVFQNKYEQEILIYNRIEDLTVVMGSYMSRGIIARFIPNEALGQINAPESVSM